MSEGRILTIWDWLSFFFFFRFLGMEVRCSGSVSVEREGTQVGTDGV